MREPAKVVAAIEIATSVRHALADAFERHQSTGWDEDILQAELARLVGFVLRLRDARPSALQHLVEMLRSVYAGLTSPHTPDASDAVRKLCPQATAGLDRSTATEGTPVQ